MTLQIIFDNILNMKIPWPSVPGDMSYEAQDLINRLVLFFAFEEFKKKKNYYVMVLVWHYYSWKSLFHFVKGLTSCVSSTWIIFCDKQISIILTQPNKRAH